ncbi:hypothetical protein GCM10027019_06390 [Melaminivora jejuensis]|uniref:hypothetical protein n=1 Tax=Melaminivora jejuensis TaxID=1267217 RepID=UPI001ADFBBB7|nr:hypothetical protein [Melaminivora jejuensis]UHJ65409.1 hypothetical protein LVC68_02460 [Melaminivora jejuensis]
MPAHLKHLHALRRLLPTRASADPQPARAPAPPLIETLDLDARTDWPTHRIRSFLTMQEDARGRGGR